MGGTLEKGGTMTAIFEKAFKLIQEKPMPDDIIEQLDAYFELIPEEEEDDFLWLYEAAQLQTNLIDPMSDQQVT